MRILLIITLLISALSVNASERADFVSTVELSWNLDSSEIIIQQDHTKVEQPKFKKLKAALLSLFLGHFGVHRIYLGTSATVPVVYTLTLGGGLGILPLIDFFHIVFSKDLERFENNDRVFMWIE